MVMVCAGIFSALNGDPTQVLAAVVLGGLLQIVMRLRATSRTLERSTPKVAHPRVSVGGSSLSSPIVTSGRNDRMCQATAREPKAGRDVLELEIGQLLDDPLRRQARCQQVENIRKPGCGGPARRDARRTGRDQR